MLVSTLFSGDWQWMVLLHWMEFPNLLQALVQISLSLQIPPHHPWMCISIPDPRMPHLQLFLPKYFESICFTYLLNPPFPLKCKPYPQALFRVAKHVADIQNKWTMWYIISGWLSTQTPMLTHMCSGNICCAPVTCKHGQVLNEGNVS